MQGWHAHKADGYPCAPHMNSTGQTSGQPLFHSQSKEIYGAQSILTAEHPHFVRHKFPMSTHIGGMLLGGGHDGMAPQKIATQAL